MESTGSFNNLTSSDKKLNKTSSDGPDFSLKKFSSDMADMSPYCGKTNSAEDNNLKKTIKITTNISDLKLKVKGSWDDWEKEIEIDMYFNNLSKGYY